MQTKSLHKTNAIAKPGIRLCPTDRCAIRKKRFWILLPRLAKVSSVSPSRGGRVPLLHGREMVLLLCDQKYHPVPLLREAGTNLLLFQGKREKDVLFHVEKREATFAEYGKSSHRIPCLGDRNFPRGRPKKQSLHTQQFIRQLGTCRWSPSRRRELL